MSKMKLPPFPEEVNIIGKDKYLTKKQIRKYILEHHKDLAEQYCLTKTFNTNTGNIDKTYAWNSIIEVMNNEGYSDTMIKYFLWI